MSLPIIWSPASRDEYADILIYIEDNFGLDAALDFLDKTDNIIDGIAEFPEMAPVSFQRPDIRKAIITKQTSVIYQVMKIEIRLLHFLNNRKNPTDIDDLF